MKRETKKKNVPSNLQGTSERDSTDGLSLHSNHLIKEKKTKPTVIGDFNDKDLIGDKKVKICGVRVWHDGQKLNGIQAIYRQGDGTIIKGRKHIENAYKYKAVKFDMDEDDYLKDVTGFVSNEDDAVQCLIFRSAKEQVRRVGNTGDQSKQFKFDINENEFPAIIYGSVKSKIFSIVDFIIF